MLVSTCAGIVSDLEYIGIKVFREYILNIPQVVECDMVAGGYDYLLKVRVSDMDEYRQVLGDLVDIRVGTHHTYGDRKN